jgi:hypothetical protein
MEIVISIIIQEKTAAYSAYVCGPHELFAENTGKIEPVSYSVS